MYQDRTLRFSRQTILPQVGPEGQERLAGSRAVIVGLGSLGSLSAQLLARVGLRDMVLVDRDIVEIHNLPRQILYTEADADQGRPKALAARERLAHIDSELALTAHVTDLDADNIEQLLAGADVVVDATDNFETRYLINDWALLAEVPWVYGGVIGTEGLCLPVVPRRTPCLRCLFPHPPASTDLPSCETAGVWTPTASVVASLQVAMALRILIGVEPNRTLAVVDGWTGEVRQMETPAPSHDCPACGRGEYAWLRVEREARVRPGCQHQTLRVRPAGIPTGDGLDLAGLARRLEPLVKVRAVNVYLLKFEADGCELTLFRDGRALVRGTKDLARARGLYDRYVGS
jgi:molybdopterin/thiamine biosynthesis adenylyltransferase